MSNAKKCNTYLSSSESKQITSTILESVSEQRGKGVPPDMIAKVLFEYALGYCRKFNTKELCLEGPAKLPNAFIPTIKSRIKTENNSIYNDEERVLKFWFHDYKARPEWCDVLSLFKYTTHDLERLSKIPENAKSALPLLNVALGIAKDLPEEEEQYMLACFLHESEIHAELKTGLTALH